MPVFRKFTANILIIVAFTLASYSNTFDVPFHFDDACNIKENPMIINSTGCLPDLSLAEGHLIYSQFKSRYLGYMTFFLNYKLGGLNVAGYHVLNLAIHIVNAVLLYALIMLTFKTPLMSGSSLLPYAQKTALFSALLFVSHPIQTEAVTYIVQRLASLAAMFYLLSMALYAASRLSGQRAARYGLYAFSFISALLAMKTKELSFTLPLAIVLYEFMFFRESARKRAVFLIPMLLTMLIIPLSYIGDVMDEGGLSSAIHKVTRVETDMPRTDYLFTQFRVIATYMRLLFLPVNQNLDYDYPVFQSFFDPLVFFSFLLLLSLLGLGMYLFFRSKRVPELRLMSFGICFFFIGLSIESGVMPILDVIFEHRVYLPSAGIFTALGAGAVFFYDKLKGKKSKTVAAASLVLLPALLAIATLGRNTVWKTEQGLWEDVVRKSPDKMRGHYNLGNKYYDRGLFDRAVEQYVLAVRLDPERAEVHNNLGNSYRAKGLYDMAMTEYLRALSLSPSLAEARRNLGDVYGRKGDYKNAITILEDVLKAKPDEVQTLSDLGAAYGLTGQYDKAVMYLEKAVRIKPDYAEAHNNLGNVYVQKGMKDMALRHYRLAVSLKPGDRRFMENLKRAER